MASRMMPLSVRVEENETSSESRCCAHSAARMKRRLPPPPPPSLLLELRLQLRLAVADADDAAGALRRVRALVAAARGRQDVTVVVVDALGDSELAALAEGPEARFFVVAKVPPTRHFFRMLPLAAAALELGPQVAFDKDDPENQ